ncbi:MAG: hypothetical protein UU77_C0003G0029 [candidate division WWE3 bacterium GW2011_GWC1_41_7]|uniref:Uncharacterized protein n=1 Tax=candidate division WWE3 bacterium GW2011_GWC1_41_7 TaxID=1619119 RepID=A0A0G0ZH76_UNCKA|nr:MAG: hypothetical protein UU77_C0003G0029 [candidate division WWE3 bacterium GW2011_GWC1_41_7]
MDILIVAPDETRAMDIALIVGINESDEHNAHLWVWHQWKYCLPVGVKPSSQRNPRTPMGVAIDLGVHAVILDLGKKRGHDLSARAIGFKFITIVTTYENLYSSLFNTNEEKEPVNNPETA